MSSVSGIDKEIIDGGNDDTTGLLCDASFGVCDLRGGYLAYPR